MFAGHVGAGLLLGRGAREVNAGVFVAAALLLDLLLWMFVLLGWEHAFVPPDFALTHQARFEFPWSHGLLAAAAWSLLAATVICLLPGSRGTVPQLGPGRARAPRPLRAAALIAAAVMSHWLLDALVHAPELPVAGPASPRLGLSLWRHMPAALAVESLLVFAGLWLYLRGSAWPRRRAIALSVLCLLLLAFTILGLTVAPPPPSAAAMAASSLATLVVVCGLALWLGRRPRATMKQQ